MSQNISERPLTKRMIEILMDCHEKELMGLQPCNAGTLRNAAGLIVRGMLATKPYKTDEGKAFIALYVTKSGLRYLAKM